LETILLKKKKNKILEMRYTDKDTYNNKMVIKENQIIDLSINTNNSIKQK